MKINKSLMTITVVMFLAACNNSTGVSADSTQNSGFKGEFSLSNTDAKSATNTNRSTSKQQLLTSIISAAVKTNDYVDGNYFLTWKDEDAPKYKPGKDFSIKTQESMFAWMNGGGYRKLGAAGEPFDGKVFSDDVGMHEYAKTLKLPDQIEDWISPLDEKIQKFIQGDISAGRDFLLRRYCILLFVEAVKPSNGWIRYDGIDKNQSEILLINRKTRLINFANLFASEIARLLPKAYKNPADLRHDFIMALNKIPNESLYAMYKQAADESGSVNMNTATIDGVTGRGTSWTAGSIQYEGQSSGWTLRTGGQTTFGQGYINGQLHEIEVVSSLEVSSKKERSNKSSGTIGTDESSKANAGVK